MKKEVSKKHKIKEKPIHKHVSKTKKKSKFFNYLLIILIAAFIYLFFKEHLIALLKTVPWLWNFITHVFNEIESRSYLGLIYLAFFGGLFFLIIPVEGTFILYLTSGKPFYAVIPILVLGYTFGLVMDYFIGYAFGKWVLKKVLKGDFEKKKERMKKTGGIVLFFSNLFPLPTPWISLVYGAMRYKLSSFFYICLIGQALKFNLLFLGIEFLKPQYTALWNIVKGIFSNFYELVKSLISVG